MRRHRTTARGILVCTRSRRLRGRPRDAPASGASRAPSRGSSSRSSRRPSSGTTTGSARQRQTRGDRHGEPVARARRRRRGREGQVLGVGSRRLHALPLRRSGTTYLYIHLNNDLTPRNDNKGGCVKDVAFAVPDGAKVTAGQQIAWNGDSGDASGNPHLHFEVHPNDGGDVNPFRHLKRASKPLFAASKGAVFSLGLRGYTRRGRRGRGDARGRPGAPVPGRPLARHRPARSRADRAARRGGRQRSTSSPARR